VSILSASNLKKAIREPGHAALRAAHLACSSASSKLFPRKLAPPAVLTLFLTYRCNLNCHMCGQNKLFKGFDKVELSANDYAEVLKEFRILKPDICLFGGEPLLYPQFGELVELIYSLGFRQHVITNGTLLAELDGSTVTKLDRITVSINGPRDVHDAITNLSGAFERAMAGIEHVKGVRDAQGARHPLIYSLVTVTQENFGLLSRVAREMKRVGADGVTFQHLSYITPQEQGEQKSLTEGTNVSDSVDFTSCYVDTPEIDTGVLRRELESARSTEGLDVFLFPNFTRRELEAYYSGEAFDVFGKKRCKFGWFEATVMPDGTLTTCMNMRLGHIGESGFMDAWRGQSWMAYRRFFAENTLPYCVRCCGLYRY